MTPTERSLARRARASYMLSAIALDKMHADALKRVCSNRGESAAVAVRRLILEAGKRLERGV